MKMDKFALQQNINPFPQLKFRHLGSFPSDYVPTLDTDTFDFINTQPTNLRGEHWIMIASFCHELYFADSLGCKVYSLLNNQHYKQMMSAPLTVSPKCLRLLYNICMFSSLQVTTRRIYMGSRC